jgi:hypothetical protein
MIRIIAIFLLFLVAGANAQVTKRISCDELKSPLTYSKYGLKTPQADTGWKCFNFFRNNQLLDAIAWESGDKRISIIEGEFEPLEEVSEYVYENQKAPFPEKDIRLFAESFLADEKFVKKNHWTESLATGYANQTKGLLFSKNNKYTVVYQNEGIHEWKGKKVINQNARFLLKGKSDKYLNVSCYGCTPDEFFSLVINPVIQQ